jgi:hypothetical protein
VGLRKTTVAEKSASFTFRLHYRLLLHPYECQWRQRPLYPVTCPALTDPVPDSSDTPPPQRLSGPADPTAYVHDSTGRKQHTKCQAMRRIILAQRSVRTQECRAFGERQAGTTG